MKLEDIRREQQYQREREADFRDLSEMLNGRAVWYSLAQILVLVVTCAWQLRHLRVRTSPECFGWHKTDIVFRISLRISGTTEWRARSVSETWTVLAYDRFTNVTRTSQCFCRRTALNCTADIDTGIRAVGWIANLCIECHDPVVHIMV